MTDALARGGPTREILTFAVSGELFGVELREIHEIVRPGPITPVPRARRDIVGVMSLRGRLVTVLDLGRALRVAEGARALPEVSAAAQSRDARACVIILSLDDEDVGFLIHEVGAVERFPEGTIEQASLIGSAERPYLRGITRRDDATMIVLLDLLPLVPGRQALPREERDEP
jgi:purine-binding chemotaxis protein CheW